MKICPCCNRENDGVKGKFCIYCGAKLVKKKHYNKNEYICVNNKDKKIKRKMKVAIIILSIVITIETIAMVILGVCQFITFNNEKEDLEGKLRIANYFKTDYSNTVDELKCENNKLKDKCNFFDRYVVFVIEGYGNYYYTYDQMEQVTHGKSYSYWAYNIEQAISLGYRAWSN